MKDIKILSLEEALVFDPLDKTCMIRILSQDCLERKFEGDFPRLLHFQKFMKVSCYEFDDVTLNDVETRYPHAELFDEYHANKIIESFGQVKDSTEHLVVHCYAGISRSSAVAVALNHIFDLGVPEESFLFPEVHSPNMHVYNTLINTARNMGKVFSSFRSGTSYFV